MDSERKLMPPRSPSESAGSAQRPQGPPRSKGLTPSASFQGHREGAPHTQGGHPITLRPEPGTTMRPQLTPEAVRAGGHSGLQGRLSGLTPAAQVLATGAKLLPPTMPQHPPAIVDQKHFLLAQSLML
ncbi:unnamed protein product [Rangifer tarandus platyrhynchus]|uniref:Uncharacterized protein n=2 Tax=Rangifer tarandus platyrhynchus TaxID=3082113 RepID=A0ABN8YSB2_RANTA|nr:unnamed protein product [Rangifer tarandus platyrhynchus]CAI9702092.1 unnamed protein product [Rangifer tarandus platyrhynchus]